MSRVSPVDRIHRENTIHSGCGGPKTQSSMLRRSHEIIQPQRRRDRLKRIPRNLPYPRPSSLSRARCLMRPGHVQVGPSSCWRLRWLSFGPGRSLHAEAFETPLKRYRRQHARRNHPSTFDRRGGPSEVGTKSRTKPAGFDFPSAMVQMPSMPGSTDWRMMSRAAEANHITICH